MGISLNFGGGYMTYAHVKTHRTVCLKRVNFTVC